jgi:hypothetical protein
MKDEEYYLSRFMRIAAERAFAADGVAFYMIDKPPGEPKRRVHNLMLELMDESTEPLWMPPSFILSMESAQRLMDDLYNCGIRPSDAGESVGALSATKFHLEDVRKLLERILDEFLERG